MKTLINKTSPEDLLVVLTLLLGLMGFGLYVYIYCNGSEFLYCAFREATGLYCPGCGVTTSILALLSGNIGKSIRYCLFVPYISVVLGIFITRYTLAKTLGGFRMPKIQVRWIYLGLAIIVVQWLVKNILGLAYDVWL